MLEIFISRELDIPVSTLNVCLIYVGKIKIDFWYYIMHGCSPELPQAKKKSVVYEGEIRSASSESYL